MRVKFKKMKPGISEFVFSNPEYIELFEIYNFKKEIVEEIKKKRKRIFLKIIASNICQYCKIYIPELLKIHEYVDFSIQFLLWEDYGEDGQIDLMDELNLTGLPTIIIYKLSEDHKPVELGRIVKEPKKTIEEDVLMIMKLDTSG